MLGHSVTVNIQPVNIKNIMNIKDIKNIMNIMNVNYIVFSHLAHARVAGDAGVVFAEGVDDGGRLLVKVRLVLCELDHGVCRRRYR